MSSSGDSDLTASYSSVSDTMETENDEDFGAVGGLVEPYRFEPEAPEDFEEPHEDGDEDGLTPAILESRSENQISIDV